jgi:hypothetical protein
MMAPTEKRIVLEWTQGPLAGLRQILGTSADLLAGRQQTQLPTFEGNIDFSIGQGIDHHGSASLVAVKQRHVVYRETMPWGKQTDGGQQTFTPGQL